jgi:hypothetical protein
MPQHLSSPVESLRKRLTKTEKQVSNLCEISDAVKQDVSVGILEVFGLSQIGRILELDHLKQRCNDGELVQRR